MSVSVNVFSDGLDIIRADSVVGFGGKVVSSVNVAVVCGGCSTVTELYVYCVEPACCSSLLGDYEIG